MNTNPKNEGVIADNEGAIADNEGAIADNEGAIADNEHMKVRIPELIYKRLLILYTLIADLMHIKLGTDL